MHPRKSRLLPLYSLLLLLAGSASAGIIVVDTTEDSVAGVQGCSVRDALEAARQDMNILGCSGASGDDTILIPAGAYQLVDTLTITTDGQDVIVAGLSIARPVFSPVGGATYVSNFDIQAGTGAGKVTLQLLNIEGAFVGVRLLDNVQLRIDEVRIRYAQEVGVEVMPSSATPPPAQPYVLLEDTVIAEIVENQGGAGTGLLLDSGPGDEQEVEIVRSQFNNNHFQGISVVGSFELSITDSEIRGNGVPQGASGGGIGQLGGDLTIFSTVIANNQGTVGGLYYADGQGILTLADVGISQNSGATGGGSSIESALANLTRVNVVENSGGGLVIFEGIVTVLDSDVSRNFSTAASLVGGGIRSTGGELYLYQTNVLDNTAQVAGGNGGGIYFEAEALTIEKSSVGLNSATLDGGGLYVDATNFASIINSTISTNQASRGAGIFVAGGSLNLSGTTTTHNVAGNTGGGLFVEPGASVAAGHTILGDNFETSPATGSPDCDGGLTSNGYNLITDLTGCSLTGATTGNLLGLSPQLALFGSVGGGSFGNLPLVGSPVIDAGPTPPNCLTADQRGLVRPIDGDQSGLAQCDIGSIEYAFEVFLDGFERGDTSRWSSSSP
ncbi:MAG: right-handed parallel beta-helix repeat-containing protein [Thermoanaerobaculia bacterium]|nr:right-handed parallel beta-helix repeat-containing protein [Thermoanaerobaculia bacterium]